MDILTSMTVLDLQDIVAAPDLMGILTSMTVLDLQDIVAAPDLMILV